MTNQPKGGAKEGRKEKGEGERRAEARPDGPAQRAGRVRHWPWERGWKGKRRK